MARAARRRVVDMIERHFGREATRRQPSHEHAQVDAAGRERARRSALQIPEAHVEIGYRDSSIARLIGWIVLGVSLVSTGVFIAMTPDLGGGWLGAAGIATVVGISTTLVLTLRKDAGRVDVSAVH